MNNKITINYITENKSCKFSELKPGRLFYYNKRTYMKTYYSSNNDLMVNIETGESSFLSPEAIVEEIPFSITTNIQ